MFYHTPGLNALQRLQSADDVTSHYLSEHLMIFSLRRFGVLVFAATGMQLFAQAIPAYVTGPRLLLPGNMIHNVSVEQSPQKALAVPPAATTPSTPQTSALPSGQPSGKPLASNIVRPRAGAFPSVLGDKTIVAFYGNPYGKYMGVLGETSIPEAIRKLRIQAKEYEAFNPAGIIPAFHLIYAVCHAEATVGYLSDDKTLEYIQAAQANDMLVILDHQLGNNNVVESVRRMLPWLQYPNVHLAIDPEWRTSIPGKEIGSVDASEVNAAMSMVQDYLVRNNIKQRKLFIVHQFQYRMITNREKLRTDFDRLDVIHNADGWGPPPLKYDTYRFVTALKTIPLKGFKLFYPKPWKGDGYDKPMLTPKDVMALDPRPVFINYQ